MDGQTFPMQRGQTSVTLSVGYLHASGDFVQPRPYLLNVRTRPDRTRYLEYGGEVG